MPPTGVSPAIRRNSWKISPQKLLHKNSSSRPISPIRGRLFRHVHASGIVHHTAHASPHMDWHCPAIPGHRYRNFPRYNYTPPHRPLCRHTMPWCLIGAYSSLSSNRMVLALKMENPNNRFQSTLHKVSGPLNRDVRLIL